MSNNVKIHLYQKIDSNLYSSSSSAAAAAATAVSSLLEDHSREMRCTRFPTMLPRRPALCLPPPVACSAIEAIVDCSSDDRRSARSLPTMLNRFIARMRRPTFANVNLELINRLVMLFLALATVLIVSLISSAAASSAAKGEKVRHHRPCLLGYALRALRGCVIRLVLARRQRCFVRFRFVLNTERLECLPAHLHGRFGQFVDMVFERAAVEIGMVKSSRCHWVLKDGARVLMSFVFCFFFSAISFRVS